MNTKPKALVVIVSATLFAIFAAVVFALVSSPATATFKEFEPDEAGYLTEIRSIIFYDKLSDQEVLQMGYNACESLELYDGDMGAILEGLSAELAENPFLEGALMRVYRAAVPNLCPQFNDSVQ